ncbi:MAG: peptidase U32 family protein [Candidatus Aadella gelida]|nr:peptidase U32 family protein [Candidatus Aadella gelida]
MKSKLNKRPELVAPSGNWSGLSSACRAGADAVYFGVKGFNMRQGAENFDILEIKKIMKFLHEEGKKGYLALNAMIYDNELGKARDILRAAKEAQVDAVVLWDAAILRMAKEMGLNVHLSTQASVSNFEAFKFYSELGIKRIVLARENTLEDIKNIISRAEKEGIKCGVETFVHGAMCLSVSGRCLLSHESFSRSANRGECIQPCRREFVIKDKENECEYTLGEDYILSAKDLCSVRFIDELITAGIDAFKIEGRNRPPEYVSEVTSVYREAIDAFYEEELSLEKKKKLEKRLLKTFNRGFTDGFYFGIPRNGEGDAERDYEKTYLGEVMKFYKKINVAEIFLRTGSLKAGQKILITGKKTPAEFFNVKEMEIEHGRVEFAQKGQKVGIKLPFNVRPKDKVFLWDEEKKDIIG